MGCTLGPRGRTLMLANGGAPHVTRDGVEAALAVQLSDPLENLGAELVRSIVAETSSRVGDCEASAPYVHCAKPGCTSTHAARPAGESAVA